MPLFLDTGHRCAFTRAMAAACEWHTSAPSMPGELERVRPQRAMSHWTPQPCLGPSQEAFGLRHPELPAALPWAPGGEASFCCLACSDACWWRLHTCLQISIQADRQLQILSHFKNEISLQNKVRILSYISSCFIHACPVLPGPLSVRRQLIRRLMFFTCKLHISCFTFH